MTGLHYPILPLIYILTFGILLTSCGVVRTGTVATGPVYDESLEAGVMLHAGIASWYGPKFHGRTTANGETYNMDDFTAAHKTMPFNTVVRVLNRENGKSVDVRINDRGPYVGDRIIDLSRRAAEEIDMIGSGTAQVEVFFLQEGDRPVTSENSSSPETFTVQLASFDNRRSAEVKVSEINGSEVFRTNFGGTIVYRVYFGTYTDQNEAERALRELQRRGHNGFVKQKEN